MNIGLLRRLVILATFTLAVSVAEALEYRTAKIRVQNPTITEPVFYSLRPDLRRCIAPLCGGYFIKAVNRKRIRCADGIRRSECYVAEILWDQIGFEADPGAALVLGIQGRKEFKGFGPLGILTPKAAWRVAGDNLDLPLGLSEHPKGTWVGLRQSGVVCVAAPCYNINQRVLNRDREQIISGVDLEQVEADPADVAAARHLLQKDELPAVGENKLIPNEGHAGDGLNFVAKNFFLPLEVSRDDALYCEVDADCTNSVYHSPVRSKDECYCPLCPQPISVAAAKQNQSDWLQYCRDYGFSVVNENRLRLICPTVLCIQPPPVGCVKNQCVNLDDAIRPYEFLPH